MWWSRRVEGRMGVMLVVAEGMTDMKRLSEKYLVEMLYLASLKDNGCKK